MSLEVTYKGQQIAELTEDGDLTLNTAGKFCEGNIGLTYSGGESGEAADKDVNFYDYSGFRLFSFTFDEINAMASDADLPVAPDVPEKYLAFAAWNWTLAEIKAHDGYVEVGALYEPTDCDAWFDVQITAPSLLTNTIRFSVDTNTTVQVDWGDGTSESVPYQSGQYALSHTWPVCGRYRLKLTIISGSGITIGGWANANLFFGVQGDAFSQSPLKAAYLGSMIKSSQVCFSAAPISEIVLGVNTKMGLGIKPMSYSRILICSRNTNTGTYGGYLPTALIAILKPIPAGNSSDYQIGHGRANGLRAIYSEKLTIPDTSTVLSERCLFDVPFLKDLHIPRSVASIKSAGIKPANESSQESVRTIWFYGQPPTLTASDSITFLCAPIILVPYDYLAGYLIWTNQPDKTVYPYIGHMVSEVDQMLPTQDRTGAYHLTWHSTMYDALNNVGQISVGNGKRVFCAWTEVS